MLGSVFATAETSLFSACHCVLASAETSLFSACHCVLASAETSQSSACHCEPVQNGNRGAPVRPGEGDAAERLKTWIFLRKSRGEGCAACIAEVWQSVLPAVKPSKLVLLQANPYALFRIRPKYYFLLCPAARRCGLPRRFAPRNDMQKHAACQHGNDVVPGEFAALFRIRRKYCPPPCPAAGVTDCRVASLLAMTEGGRPCTR